MAFRIGQKVVFVGWNDDDELAIDESNLPCPDFGEICTVVAIHREGPFMSLEIAEYPAAPTDRFMPGWDADGFRPAVEKKEETGMAILRKILERESHQDRAPAKATIGRETDAGVRHGTEEA